MGVNGGAASSAATRTICDGDTAIFNITGDGWNGGGAVSNRSYQWMKDGAQVALTNTPTLNYSTFTGVENFFVRVFDRALQNSVTLDPLACESTTNSITVTTNGSIGINLVSNATNNTFCDGEEIIFEATAIASATYTFFCRDYTIRQAASISNTFSVNNLVDGDNVRVLVNFISGCTATTSLTMTKNDITSAGTISPVLQRISLILYQTN